MSLKWQDPPASSSRHQAERWMEEADELRANPGQWALLRSWSKSNGASTFKLSAIQGRRKAFLPVGDWEFRVSRGDLFVRYIGSLGSGGVS